MYVVKKVLPEKPGRIISLPKTRIGCDFRAEKYRADGTVTYRGPWFSNTVLNTGLDQLQYSRSIIPGDAYSSVCYHLNVGTGTSEPAVTNTGLDNWTTSTISKYGNGTRNYSVGDIGVGTPCWRSWQVTFAFSVGFLGSATNLTELGMSYSSNSSYFNRQLFRDELGDPTVIPVQTDEGLRVTVKLTVYGPLPVDGTAVGDFILDGTTRAATITQLGGAWLTNNEDRRFNISDLPNTEAIKIATNTGSFVSPNSRSSLAYTSGDYYRDNEYTWNPGQFTGDWKRTKFFIRAWAYLEMFELVLDSAITINDTDELKLTFRRSWGRV